MLARTKASTQSGMRKTWGCQSSSGLPVVDMLAISIRPKPCAKIVKLVKADTQN